MIYIIKHHLLIFVLDDAIYFDVKSPTTLDEGLNQHNYNNNSYKYRKRLDR